MSKHTPGPWRVGKHYSEVIADMPANPPFRGMTDDCVKHYGGYLVAESCAEADGRLIAAAPELLSIALRFVALDSVWHPERYEDEKRELMKDARAVIAKAQSEP